MTKKSRGEFKVSQRNELVEAHQKTPLTLQETRIILTMVSEIQPTDKSFLKQRISVTEFAKLIDAKGEIHGYIKKVSDDLLGKKIHIPTKTGWLKTTWFQSVEYFAGEGVIELMFSEKLAPYLLNLQKEFISYKLEYALSLKSSYAIRIYELAYKWNGSRQAIRYSLDELREMIGATKKTYDNFGDFKRAILNPAIKEISEKTDLTVDFSEIKTGRKVTGIELTIKEKPKPKKASGTKKKTAKKNETV